MDSGEPEILSRRRRLRRAGAVLTVLFFSAYVNSSFLHGRPLFDSLENLWQDGLWRFNAGRATEGDPHILIAALDEDTVERFSWPLPRGVLAQLIDRLASLGVRAVAFDVMFPQPRLGDEAGDLQLIQATQRSAMTIHSGTYDGATTRNDPWLRTHWTVSAPMKGLAEASRAIGNVSVRPDDDGHLRRVDLARDVAPEYSHLKENPLPSLALAAVSVFAERPLRYYLDRFGADTSYLLNFRRAKSWPRHPAKAGDEAGVAAMYQPICAADILQDTLTASQRQALRGSLVFVGSTALGAFDHFPAPFSSLHPGVEFNALAADNLLHEDFASGTVPGLSLLALLVMVWIPLFAFPLTTTAAVGLPLAALAAWLGIAEGAFLRHCRLETVGPAVALVVSLFVALVLRSKESL